MNNKKGKESKLLNSRIFYAVVMSLVIAIVGVASVIYNLSKIKNVLPQEGETGFYSVTTKTATSEHQANMPATGIPDERDDDETDASEKSTVDDLNRPYTGRYLLPLNSNVGKSFSDGNMVYSKTMDDWRIHDGIDITGSIGDNAIAINDGSVTAVYSDALWGEVIEIKHGNGLTAKYCGVKSALQKDSAVKQGQVIGTVVEIPAEKEDGVHVHLEITVDDKTVDPIKALNLMSDSPTSE